MRMRDLLLGISLSCLLLACGGGERSVVARPAAPATPLADQLAKCRTDIEVCGELSDEMLAPIARPGACDEGDPDACMALGLAYFNGTGFAEDPVRGRQRLERACTLAHAGACAMLGVYVARDLTTEQGARRARPFLVRACEGGEAMSCMLLARFRLRGAAGTAEDEQAAEKLYARSCALKPGQGCGELGLLLQDREGVPESRICALFAAGCEGGDEGSCRGLVESCAESHQELASSFEDFDLALEECRARNASCSAAGKLREGAPGVSAKPREALELYTKGCSAGEAEGCLGQARLASHAEPPGDPRKILDEACLRAVAGTCLALGRDYRAGTSGGRAPALALQRFEQACAQGEREGCLELARGRRDQIAGDVARATVQATFRSACAVGSLVACQEGKLVDPGAALWFQAQACFHDDASCAGGNAGLAVTAKIIPLGWDQKEQRALTFAGPEQHAVLASARNEIAMIDPVGGTTTSWSSLASADRRGPQPGRYRLQHGIYGSVWRWDASGGGLVGMIGVNGYGKGVERGVALWSPMKEALPRMALPNETRWFDPMAWSPDGRLGVVAGRHDHDGGAYLLDLAKAQSSQPQIGDKRATVATFSADSSRAAIGFAGGKIAIVSSPTQAVSMLEASQDEISSLSFHPTRPTLVSVDRRQRVRIWQLDAPGQGEITLPSPGQHAAFSPDGRYLAIAGARELVLLDAAELHRVARPVKIGESAASYPRAAMAFSPDSRYLAIAGPRDVTILDLTPGAATVAIDRAWFNELRRLPTPAAPPAPRFERGAVISGVVSLDGKPVAGAEIEIRPSPGEWPDARALPPRFTRSGSDGRFAFEKVPEIEWVITASTPDTQTSQGTVDLRQDKARGRRDLRLEPRRTLRVKILDASGRPAPGARIGGGGEDFVADRTGAVVMRHLPTSYGFSLHAQRADGAASSIVVGTSSPDDPPELVVRLLAPSDPRVIRIKVVDGRGRPMPGARVELNITQYGGLTDARGMVAAVVSGKTVNVEVKVGPETWASRTIELPQRGVVTLTAAPPP